MPELLAVVEASAARLRACEEGVAANNEDVHDCQPNPDADPNLKDVRSDETKAGVAANNEDVHDCQPNPDDEGYDDKRKTDVRPNYVDTPTFGKKVC